MTRKDAHLRGSDQQCPKCGSRKITVDRDMVAGGHGPGIAACPNCNVTWEFFSAEQLLDPAPYSSFKEPCNNCAFRKGSPEQADPYLWMQIKESIEAGAPFYCHKGVPITPNTGHGFAYPQKTITVGCDGTQTTTQVPDTRKLRFCRGWLNSRYSKVRRQNEEA